jgi:hypothetical protein
MEVLFILVPICVFLLLKIVLEHRAQARADNVRLLEEALRSPHLDRPTIESLTYQLTGRRALRDRGNGPGRLLALVMVVGWLTLFAGIGVWVGGVADGIGDMITGGLVTAVIGFGLVTYPFALRELEARRQPQ